MYALKKGGESGSRGLNLIIYPDGRLVNIGGKTTVPVSAGVILFNTTKYFECY